MVIGPREARRVQRVLDYVHRHIDDDRLTVERVSRVARISKWHFHRRFSEVLGINVHEYIRLVRLRRSAYDIAFRERPLLDIALSSGYASHAAFSRAFRRIVGQTPSDFRVMARSGEWLGVWADVQRRLGAPTPRHRSGHERSSVRILFFPATRVAALEHRGDPGSLHLSLQRFIAWRRRQPRSVRTSETFNLVYSEPTTMPELFRFDICAATNRAVAANDFGVVERTIAGGRCAAARHVGSNASLSDTVGMLRRWVRLQRDTPGEPPLILHRVQRFPDVPEHEAVTDVMLPLA